MPRKQLLFPANNICPCWRGLRSSEVFAKLMLGIARERERFRGKPFVLADANTVAMDVFPGDF